MKSIDLKLPAIKDDLRICHRAAIIDPIFQLEVDTIQARVAFMAKFIGSPEPELWRWDMDDLNKAFYHCIKLLNQVDIS